MVFHVFFPALFSRKCVLELHESILSQSQSTYLDCHANPECNVSKMFPIVSCCILIADLWPIWPGLGWGMRRPTMAAIWDGHHLNVPCIGRQVIRLHHGCNKPCEIRQCYYHCITVVFQMVRLDILLYIMHINVLYNFNEKTYILCFYYVSMEYLLVSSCIGYID